MANFAKFLGVFYGDIGQSFWLFFPFFLSHFGMGLPGIQNCYLRLLNAAMPDCDHFSLDGL